MNRYFYITFVLASALTVSASGFQRSHAFAQTPRDAARMPQDAAQMPQDAAQMPRDAAQKISGDDQFFKDIYREFYETYRLGPGDEIAIRVTGHPDYSLERAKVTPTGSVYHPLLGDIDVAGMTVPKLIKGLTRDLGEYLIDPKVSAALLEANSAKIGVIGDIMRPGILVMNKPMTVLEAVTASGGFTDTGNKSGVIVLRSTNDGRAQTLKVNVKRILEGKAGEEENIALHAGDTVIVNGNTRKKLSNILSLAGFASFLSFISAGGGR